MKCTGLKLRSELTGPELVAQYNNFAAKLGLKSVKRFSNRATGIKRTEKLAVELAELESASLPNKEEKTTEKPSIIIKESALEAVRGAKEKIKIVLCEKRTKGAVSRCKDIFTAGFENDINYTRKTFLSECEANGIKKSTSGKQWLKFGGPRTR